MQPDPLVGKSIGPYLVLEKIGAGGMGTVFSVFHEFLDDVHALKVLHRFLISDQQVISRFLLEAKAMKRLKDCKNIVEIFDVNITEIDGDSCGYIAMEFVTGRSLEEIIRKATNSQSRHIPLEIAYQVFYQIVNAIEYAHQRHIIHRDIKPANVIIAIDGLVKLTDFGIATSLSSRRNQEKDYVYGTLPYLALQQIISNEADVRNDIYSLGMTFYKLLTGVNPLEKMTDKQIVDFLITSKQLSSPSIFRPSLPECAIQTIKKCVHKNIGQRFQNVSQLKNRLIKEWERLFGKTEQELRQYTPIAKYLSELSAPPSNEPQIDTPSTSALERASRLTDSYPPHKITLRENRIITEKISKAGIESKEEVEFEAISTPEDQDPFEEVQTNEKAESKTFSTDSSDRESLSIPIDSIFSKIDSKNNKPWLLIMIIAFLALFAISGFLYFSTKTKTSDIAKNTIKTGKKSPDSLGSDAGVKGVVEPPPMASASAMRLAATQTPIEPTVTLIPSPLPSATRTTTPSPTMTDTPLPAPELTFNTSRTQVMKGHKVILSWSSQWAETVELDGEKVELSGETVVYPKQSHTYSLKATGPSGSVEKKILVKALSPPTAKPKPKVVEGEFQASDKGVTLPKLKWRVEPQVPAGVDRSTLVGNLILGVLVGPDGKVKDIKVRPSSIRDMEVIGASKKAVRKWEYNPGKKDGIPASVWIQEIIRF